MPTVNLSAETYEKLKRLAERTDSDPDSAAEGIIELQLAAPPVSQEQWVESFRAIRQEIQTELDPELTDDQIHMQIDEAIREVRAKHRARSR